MTLDAGALERGWRLAEARGPDPGDAVAADPLTVQANGKPLLAGVDSLGVRHLLIPIGAEIEAAVEPSGLAVTLRKRPLVLDSLEQWYLDLACLRPDLFDEFSVLAADVVAAVESNSTNTAAAVAEVLASWRELLRAISAPRLDRGGVIGLYGELSLLERILNIDARLGVEAWTGPTRARYDFQRGPVILEVKSSTARRGRPIIVHGIDQLEGPAEGSLYLAWIRLEVGIERGRSLRSIVDQLLGSTLDPAGLEQKLRNAGYDFEHPEIHDRPSFTELETRFYVVDEAFPTLTRKNLVGGELPRGVVAVTYEIDLSGDVPGPLGPADEEHVLRALAGAP